MYTRIRAQHVKKQSSERAASVFGGGDAPCEPKVDLKSSDAKTGNRNWKPIFLKARSPRCNVSLSSVNDRFFETKTANIF